MLSQNNNKKYKQQLENMGAVFKGMLNFTINATNLDKTFFVYYEGGIADGMLQGKGEVWLFCPDNRDNSMYYWEGEFTDGFPVRSRCSDTNFPYGANLLEDLDTYLQSTMSNREKNLFTSGFTHRNWRTAVVGYNGLQSQTDAPVTPPSFPAHVDTPERITSYAKHRSRLSSVTSI